MPLENPVPSARVLPLVLLLAACGGSAPPGQVTPAQEAEVRAAQEIMLLEEQWGRALSRRDTAFFARILADEFVSTGGEELRSKAEVIRELSAARGPLPAPNLRSARVRIYGDVAVVTGLATFEGAKGPAAPLTRFSEVWVRRGGSWQAVHGHYNPVGTNGARP